MGVTNLKSSGKRSAARGYINLYDCRMVTSATPAMSPISFCRAQSTKNEDPRIEFQRRTLDGASINSRYNNTNNCCSDKKQGPS